MTHLGCYYGLEHHRESDRDYIAKLNPPVIRLLDPDVQQIADLHALVPGAIIAPRTWVIDDNNGDAVRNLMDNPIKTGLDHANQYRGQLDRWKQEASQRGLTLPADDHIYFNSANEPNQGGTPETIARYTVAFLDRCTKLGIRATVLCLGVGWPDNTGPDTPVNWQPYAAIVEPIQRGGHWLELHEYHYKDGPQNNWTWWAGRHLQCPFDVPILLGEIGVDNYVDQKRWEKDGGNRGWLGNVDPNAYADMIQWHISHSDTRVVAALPFLTDYRKNEWRTFDTDPAHGALLARKDAMVPQAKPKTSGTAPPPPTTTTPLYVNVPNGARLRGAPNTSAPVLDNIPFAERVNATGTTEITGGAQWTEVHAGNGKQGWIFGALLSPTEPAPSVTPTTGTGPTEPVPAPTPMATGIIDPRVAQAILDVESDGRAFGPDGRPLIRFEAHIFKSKLGNDARFDQFFRFNPDKPWIGQERRITVDHPWKPIHTGSQADEYDAFAEAQMLGVEAAHQSISMGAAQILGFNHAKIGYPTAEAMYKAFSDPNMQVLGFINYCLATPGLLEAIKTKNWEQVAGLYNGTGNIPLYSKLLRDAYESLGAT